MRIALIHSFYSSDQPSGENRVVVDQADALQRAGHEVRIIARHTDDLAGSSTYHVRSAWTVATGRGASPVDELREFNPDIVHIHNLFPNFATNWVASWHGPVVATLHNYRAVCANGLLYRDGHQCSECPDGSPLQAVRHGCYRGSRMATIPVAVGLSRRGPTFLDHVDRVVVTSPGSARILGGYLPGLAPFDLVPNFGVGQSQQPLAASERTSWLAMGRFTPEKGFLELIEMWPHGSALIVIGDGPQSEALAVAAKEKAITIRPSMPIEELRRILPSHRGLVFPSRWPDVAPQVVVEAMRVGLPVIAHRANVVADLVASSGAGAAYDDAPSLAEALEAISVDLPLMSAQAVRTFERDWTEESWLAGIEAVYSFAISVRTGRPERGPRA
jgi:glycosyltransferase involved in cell wall biosynthesis